MTSNKNMMSLQSSYITLLWYREKKYGEVYYFGAFSIMEKSLQINIKVYLVENMVQFYKKK